MPLRMPFIRTLLQTWRDAALERRQKKPKCSSTGYGSTRSVRRSLCCARYVVDEVLFEGSVPCTGCSPGEVSWDSESMARWYTEGTEVEEYGLEDGTKETFLKYFPSK